MRAETFKPRAARIAATRVASVVFPAPEKPTNPTAKGGVRGAQCVTLLGSALCVMVLFDQKGLSANSATNALTASKSFGM